MAGYATITREEAQRQQGEIAPPQKAPGSVEPPKGAAPGSHPNCPVESDPEALAAYQGAEKLAPENIGSWHLNAWNQPVWVPGRGAEGGGAAGPRTVSPENRLPEDTPKRAEAKPEEKPAVRRG